MLTDLLHLEELLLRGERERRRNPVALMQWFRRLNEESGGDVGLASEDLQQRPDAEADAVRVSTIHKSKGLEYGVVYCPFTWTGKFAEVAVKFHDEQGNITGTGTGAHGVNVTAGEDCWVSSVSAPGFAVAIQGTATDETLNFVVYPNPMILISFVITCPHGDDDPTDYPYPMAEGLIEGSILSQDIMISVARQDGAEDSGSGSRSEGTDIPMEYSYEVTVNR